jgi:hypothetical protein
MSAFIKISPSNFGYTNTTSLSFSPDDYTIANYTNFTWLFGDGKNSTEITPQHLYNKSGEFKVQLNATDPYGNSVFLTSSVNINGIASNRDSGYANATNFEFSIDPAYANTYKAVLWNFGDGETSRNPFSSHQYKTPGVYNVHVSVYTNSGSSYTYSKQIEVNLFLNESIYFDIIPPPTFAGHLNRYPFKINITSSDTDDHYIDLGAQFSKSYQFQEPLNNWSFLRPQWKFLDLEGNQISSIKTQDTLIRIDDSGNISPDGYVIGVTGTAQFYFVDDLYNTDLYLQKQPYSTIIATLQTSAIRSIHDSLNLDSTTPSFANSLASVTLPHIFTWREPDFIRITQNGIVPISNIRFTGQQNPILINFGFNKTFSKDDLVDGNGVEPSSEFEFPNYVPFDEETMFDLFSSTNIPFTLSAYDLKGEGLNFSYSPSAKEFDFKDKDGFKTGGYYKGSFINETSTIDCYIEGNGYFPIPDISSRYINPVLWVSNPMAGMMGSAQYYYNKAASAVNLNYMDKVHVNTFNMPIVESFDDNTFFATNAFAVSGFHGIANIAALPGPSYHAWMVDSELNKLYRVNSVGDILINIDLNAVLNTLKYNLNPPPDFLIPDQVSPMGLSLDSQKNVWVAFYDTPYVFKFDNLGNYITYTNFNNIENVENPRFLQWWRDQSDVYSTSMETDDNYPIQPTFIETDLEDNVWVTYSNPFSGWLVKYLSSGNVLNSIQYDGYTAPLEIACDSTNNIWICTDHSIGGGYLEKRDTNGTLLSTYGPFAGINHLTLDRNQNPWFTFSYQWVGTVNSQNGRFSSINITDNSYSDKIPDWFYPDYDSEETALGGITSDINGKIYIINSIENKVFIVDSYTQSIEDRFRINPKGFVYTLSAEKAPTELEYNPWSKSAKAIGDWSGFRWANKYQEADYDNISYLKYNGTTYKAISGTTLPNYISFYPPNYYDIFKINENFDLGEQMKSLAFMPSLLESENLFNFLGSIYGQAPFKHDDLGVLSYEKISNFVSNQSDIDTCDVDSLYDLAAAVDMNSDDFRLNFPLAIKRAMNILSVNQSRLFGGEMDDSFNFSSYNKHHNFNRGELLSSLTYTVTAGTPVILKPKSLNDYKLITTGQLHSNPEDVLDYNLISLNTEGNLNYSLDILAYSLNLGKEWEDYYEFYEFIPSENIVNTDNLIDWDNFNADKQKYIEFLKNQRQGEYPDSYLKWDGDDGMMEFIFTYLFYKGLGLI